MSSCTISSRDLDLRLFETLLAVEGQVRHIAYHQARLERSFSALFPSGVAPKISEHLDPPKKGIFRVRFVYGQHSVDVAYSPYEKVYQNDFVLVDAGFTYEHKFLDRSDFDDLKKLYPGKELILCREGLLCDTTIANIACLIDGLWYTPASPLLEGTTRARLIDEKRLIPKEITVKAFQNAAKFGLMNALTGFYEVKNATIAYKSK